MAIWMLAGPVFAVDAGAQQLGSDDQVVARVGNDQLTLADLNQAWHKNDASARIRMLQQLYDTQRRALDVLIGDYLIDREAKSRGLTREELLARELPARTEPVTDTRIDEIYEINKERFTGRTLEQMRPEIRALLEQQLPVQALHIFMGELRMTADDVEILLEPPRMAVATLADDPVQGSRTAPIEIVEFSDFQCPYCLRVVGTLEEIREKYGDLIRLVYKDFPLTSHAQAFKAAEAGNCASEQGKFWEYHDKLFASQSALYVPDLKRYATDLGLDAEAFNACLDGGRYTASVEDDLQIGQGYGVSSTPTIFINGRPIMGAAPTEVFEQIIEEELARAAR